VWADKFRDSDRNTTKIRYNLTREWHFVDLEIDHPDMSTACFGHSAAAAPASAGPAKACVVDRIAAFQAELKSLPSTDPERVVALKFLLHFVGDVHQPLHAADHDDQGANKVMVLFANRTVGTALHGFWDTDVVTRFGHDPATVADTLDRKFGDQCDGWMAAGPADWAQESFVLARDNAYKLGQQTSDSHGNPAYRLSSQYQAQALIVAGEQLGKAGCRLAMMLNQSLR
jgi:hypothetical protein